VKIQSSSFLPPSNSPFQCFIDQVQLESEMPTPNLIHSTPA